jgi:hypothetical protein
MDTTGKICPRDSTQYDYAWSFKNGEALVKTGDRYYYIDGSGRFSRPYNAQDGSAPQ